MDGRAIARFDQALVAPTADQSDYGRVVIGILEQNDTSRQLGILKS